MAPFAIDDILSENPIHFQDQKFCQLGVETQTDIDVLPHCYKILTRYSTAHRCPNSHHGLGGICLNICVRFGQGTSEGFQISRLGSLLFRATPRGCNGVDALDSQFAAVVT